MNVTPPAGPASDEPEFRLADGGPIYQRALLDRLPDSRKGALRTRLLLFFALTWLPLALLTAMAGSFLGTGAGTRPFLSDIAIHARFLLVLPLLLLAEPVIHLRTGAVLRYLRESTLLTRDDRPAFQAALDRARRWRDSGVVEALLLVLSLSLAVLGFLAGPLEAQLAQRGTTWQWTATGAVSPAGWWNVFVSGPLFLFHVLRWLYRYLLWTFLLKRLASLDLRLQPSHPDAAGGLGVLSLGQHAFAIVFIAISMMTSASLAADILFEGHSVMEYRVAIAVYVVLSLALLFGPLALFLRRARLAREAGLVRYGASAGAIWEEFERRWMGGGGAGRREGDIDPSTLADFSTAHANIVRMSPFPLDRKILLSAAVGIVAPYLPLLLTVMSLKDIFRGLLKALM